MKIIAAAVTVTAIVAAGIVQGSDDEHHDERTVLSWFDRTTPRIRPNDSGPYVEECGSCHFPYQPGLLPVLSWERIMNGLNDHFGENVALHENNLHKIRNFLLNNAAGRVNSALPNKILAAQGGRPAPLRITQTHYFVHEHSGLPRKMVQDNPGVGSFSDCAICHQAAKQGIYDEQTVPIPDFARRDE